MSLVEPNQASAVLGGLAPAAFMRRHWQRRPLLVRQAFPGVVAPLTRAALFALAARDDVESRCVQRDLQSSGVGAAGWRVRPGPLARRSLPPLAAPGWTLLVQGVDLHVSAAHDLLAPFRFLPAARLDDLMVSWASEGGGVGPHADSYDVFLVQVQGRRRWRVAAPGEGAFVAGLPLKILARFEPVHDWVLEPGDMLYLPPGWGHDGVAVGGPCMTCSVGFRAPLAKEAAHDLLVRIAEAAADAAVDDVADASADAKPAARSAWVSARRYRDAGIAATRTPALVPLALQRFAEQAVASALREPHALARALGEWLSEPKPQVWFAPPASDPAAAGAGARAVRLDRRSRMLYDARHVYFNGESWRIGGRDGTLLRRLADGGALAAADVQRLGHDAREAVRGWVADGWLIEEST